MSSSTNMLMRLLNVYLADENDKSSSSSSSSSDNHNIQNEVEVRFHTGKSSKPITKIDYEHVVQKLVSCGFESENVTGQHYLRMSPARSSVAGSASDRTIRAEINGIDLIQEYCINEDLERLFLLSENKQKVKFTQKVSVIDNNTGLPLQNIQVEDFSYSISYKKEHDVSWDAVDMKSPESTLAKSTLDTWKNLDKVYRFINRVQFRHDTIPILVDISIVKSSTGMKPTRNMHQSNVLSNLPKYEIELELDNSRIVGKSSNEVLDHLRKCIRIVLSGLQGSDFPISNSEQNKVLDAYRQITNITAATDNATAPSPIIFIGPSSVTLQLKNIDRGAGGGSGGGDREKNEQNRDANANANANPNPNPNPNPIPFQIPKINKDYTVTDKADGERKLLFIYDVDGGGPSAKGAVRPTGTRSSKVYFIDQNLNVSFTGRYVPFVISDSILDGEHILHDKHGNYYNSFAAFDIYYYQKQRQDRSLIIDRTSGQAPIIGQQSRLELVQYIIGKINSTGSSKPIGNGEGNNIIEGDVGGVAGGVGGVGTVKFFPKTFYSSENIFNCCKKILYPDSQVYNIDGLIFTPKHANFQLASLNGGKTWIESLKWKPPKYNTVDFLVSLMPTIKNIYSDSGKRKQFKVLKLFCGYGQNDLSLLPWTALIRGEIEPIRYNQSSYKKGMFVSVNPYISSASYCYIEVNGQNDNDQIMKTLDNQIIETDTIVEFAWNHGKWVPLRVRYDKTSEYVAGKSQFGNSFRVANDNWYSIFHPVTESIITGNFKNRSNEGGGDGDGDGDGDDNDVDNAANNNDVYYNKQYKNGNQYNSFMVLRKFHNEVKMALYNSVKRFTGGDIIIDFAVGRGGDLNKYEKIGAAFVFGLDVAADNIFNSRDSVCSRYVQSCQKRPMFKAMFLVGDSGMNIMKTQKAFNPVELSTSPSASPSTSPSAPSSPLQSNDQMEIARTVLQTSSSSSSSSNHGKEELGKGILKVAGLGADGFSISTCQFAIHYFFKSIQTLHEFLRNVSECTRIDGHFIATCFDGKKVFDYLKEHNIHQGEKRELYDNVDDVGGGGRQDGPGELLWSITKRYSDAITEFSNDSTSIGMVIDVFQESINKTFPEYLVNSDYLCELMALYGFRIKEKKSFREYEHVVRLGYGGGNNVSKLGPEAREVSFMNMTLTFQKIQDVDAASISEKHINSAQSSIGRKNAADDTSVFRIKLQKSKRTRLFIINEKNDDQINHDDIFRDGHGPVKSQGESSVTKSEPGSKFESEFASNSESALEQAKINPVLPNKTFRMKRRP